MARGKIRRADNAGMGTETCGKEARRQMRRKPGKLRANGFEIAGCQTDAAADDNSLRRKHHLYVAA